MLLSAHSTGWVKRSGAHWRFSAVQERPDHNERWNVHIYSALFTPPYYGGYDSAGVLHAGGAIYGAPLEDCIHRAERLYWRFAVGHLLGYGPTNPQSRFEQHNFIPDRDDRLRPIAPARFPKVCEYPDKPDICEFHTTRPVTWGGREQRASVVRDPDTREWGVWLSGATPGWLAAGGKPYRAPSDISASRAERWYWQKVYGVPLLHEGHFPQPAWETDNHIPDADDDLVAAPLERAASS